MTAFAGPCPLHNGHLNPASTASPWSADPGAPCRLSRRGKLRPSNDAARGHPVRAAADLPRRRRGGGGGGGSTPQAGFGRFLRGGVGGPFSGDREADADVARLPANDTPCACASGLAYGKCCRRFHTNTAAPAAALDVLRSRYAAYAYRLPAYIMRTTHRSTAELDRMKWRAEIMDFATEYRFCDGVEVVEQNMTSSDSTTILFRANMRRRTTPVSFMELARFARDSNQWYYVDGKLVDVDDSG